MKQNKKLLLIFFFLTGLTGLIYELVWTRLLILTFGSTHFAITTVLTTFMAGLAIGSILFGKITDRYPVPLKIFALIEISIGVYCFLTPSIFHLLKSIYVENISSNYVFTTFNPFQFFLSFCGIIIPTTLMGGTLPVMVKFFSEIETADGISISDSTKTSDPVGSSAGILYAVNTFGAVTGTLITGLFLLSFFGINISLFLAGFVDLVIGIIILFLQKSFITNQRAEVVSNEPKSQFNNIQNNRGTGGISNSVILTCFCLSGFTSLAYEVLWSRVLSLILGSSVYAFTIILTAFLTGISVGSIIYTKFFNKTKYPIVWFALLEAIIGISSVISIFLYDKLPFLFGKIHSSFAQNFWLFLFIQFFICLLIMIIPTLSMGATFPVVSRLYAGSLKQMGTKIGKVYFFNTIGSIAGSFIAGFVMIPYIGIQPSIWIMGLVNMSLFWILIFDSEISRVKKMTTFAIPSAVILISILTLPPWDKNVMTMGPYVTPVFSEKGLSGSSEQLLKSKLVYYKEGLNAVITVREFGDEISYQANGKVEAKIKSGKPSEAWYLLGHIPLLLTDDPKEALLIGLGSGITLGAMEEYPVKKFDVVELEPAVVEASTFFSAANNNATKDKRVSMHVTDGRGFLASTQKKYDVIISGVSDPWISGVSNLFTIEYFQELHKKLAEGGTAAIWYQNYKSSDEDFKTGINTFAQVFPYVSIWFHYSLTADLIVIGTKDDRNFDIGKMGKKFADNNVREGLNRINVESPFDIFEFFLIGNNDLRKYLKNADINKDNRPILEFSLPKAQYTHDYGSATRIQEIIAQVEEVIPPVNLPAQKEELEKFLVLLGQVFERDSFRDKQNIEISQKILELNGENSYAKGILSR